MNTDELMEWTDNIMTEKQETNNPFEKALKAGFSLSCGENWMVWESGEWVAKNLPAKQKAATILYCGGNPTDAIEALLRKHNDRYQPAPTGQRNEPMNDMQFTSTAYLRIGYYSRQLGPLVWSPEDWERPLIQCVNDIVDTPNGPAHVTAVNPDVVIRPMTWAELGCD